MKRENKKNRRQRMFLKEVIPAPYVVRSYDYEKGCFGEDYLQCYFKQSNSVVAPISFDLVYYECPADVTQRIFTHVCKDDELYLTGNSFQQFITGLSGQAEKMFIL